MKTEIIKIKGDWEEVANDCRATVSKGELGHEPSKEFKRRLMISEHDPIRDIIVKFRWWIKYWSAMHWKTHIWRSRTNTQRNDRQSDYDRNSAPQNAPVDMMWSVNGEELITIANKRLCNLASQKTRELVRMICREVIKLCPEFKDELVPMCVRNGGVCYEMFPCGERKDHER